MNGRAIGATFYWIIFSTFVAVKVGGVSLAAWSWWWILLPMVPVIGIFVQRSGL
jgi:hypothetical protein